MEPMAQAHARRTALPVILIAAVIQGWSLYALHRAIEAHHWPATHLEWLLGLYAVVLIAPTTVELMAVLAERTSLWVLTALLACAVFYFGWHDGGAVADVEAQDFAQRGDFFPLAFVLLVWWLLTLPFLQSRVTTRLWTVDYQRLFSFAWHNVITLAEAALFTGLFWLILFLWQSLFHMLQIDFFRTLFEKPIFAYPVTAIVFGCALHLIGSIDTLVSAVLEQVLNVLKWLATVAGALLILFTLALLTKLPGLVTSGRHAIDAEWLLWLMAVIVLFLNAADWSRFEPWVTAQNVAQSTAGVFVDLRGDGSEEFVLFSLGGGPVYQNHEGRWDIIGTLYPDGRTAPWTVLLEALSGGSVSAVSPPWKDLSVGSHLYRVVPRPELGFKTTAGGAPAQVLQ